MNTIKMEALIFYSHKLFTYHRPVKITKPYLGMVRVKHRNKLGGFGKLPKRKFFVVCSKQSQHSFIPYYALKKKES